ncbi:SPASM domain peptide maturase, grasp-with-spasm system [Chryseobacterium taeanense]|uniref:SPASM domain peptide maturase, grasp-with-spasm system n=1 Tax=Chryseobacterium taeanense TaxID=311334 RepID=A0A1G8GL17_9FLAO|nr:grasp-with-spasm system SPASM domain peptide maturase [Chryseobacterium taeanense]SDH95053.1 SPASM domain peptide maturase, grasp-with-spasm system [Chryseobacterium taeanense]
MKKKFKLYSNCLPVKGKNRSIICDLQRCNYEYVPNDLYNILKKYNGKKTIEEIKHIFENQYDDIIDEYFNFLLEKEFVFLTYYPKYFPKLDQGFYYPFEISNAIIELSSDDFIFDILLKLNDINCKSIEVRIENNLSVNSIKNILEYIAFNEMIISSISIIINFSTDLDELVLKEILNNTTRLASVTIYNSPTEYYIESESKDGRHIFFTIKNFTDNRCCGKISPQYFSPNIQIFTESLHHNSCLHKKISVDAEGNIKNCPSMPQNFGNIKDTTLEEALQHPDFKKYWNLTKDQIEVCKDCEFRYICTDCRAYTERTHTNADRLDISKPLKCGYNPYTGEWQEWSTNPLKQKAIQHYGMQNLIKKR